MTAVQKVDYSHKVDQLEREHPAIRQFSMAECLQQVLQHFHPLQGCPRCIREDGNECSIKINWAGPVSPALDPVPCVPCRMPSWLADQSQRLCVFARTVFTKFSGPVASGNPRSRRLLQWLRFSRSSAWSCTYASWSWWREWARCWVTGTSQSTRR